MREIEASLERSPEMSLNAAIIAWERRHSLEESTALLDEAVDVQMRLIRRATIDQQYFVHFNPALLFEIAEHFLVHCGPEPGVHDDDSPAARALSKATKLLQYTCTQVGILLPFAVKRQALRY